jgi:hypothetical protein
VFRADNAIKLPITEARFCIYNRGALRNVNAPWDQTTPRRRGTTLIALIATLAQMLIQRSAHALV